MSKDEQELAIASKRVTEAIKAAGFVDFYFVGTNRFGYRTSNYRVGDQGEEFAWQNAERMDRLVGAMTRQIARWEADEACNQMNQEGPR